MKKLIMALLLASLADQVYADTLFIEAESFIPSSNGWQVSRDAQSRPASAVATLEGCTGDGKDVALYQGLIQSQGVYRVWVRYYYIERWRGPFRLEIVQDGQERAGQDFDVQPLPGVESKTYTWSYFETPLTNGPFSLRLSKYQNKNCSGYVRHVDCVLLTTETNRIPNHIDFGPQTYLRVHFGEGYATSLYAHIFVDHYRSPWYDHFNLSAKGGRAGISPPKGSLLAAGTSTPWCNISQALYQDSGAILNITLRHSYIKPAEKMKARFDFATAPNEESIVKSFDVDSENNGLVVVCPPDLTTPENKARLKRDLDFALETGKTADAFSWPTIGKKPALFPFFVSVRVGGYGTEVEKAVADREWKTLDYFGFANRTRPFIGGGLWHAIGDSYCRPDLARMKAMAIERVTAFKSGGQSVSNIAFSMLTDEPTGQALDFMAKDDAYQQSFRAWLKSLGKSPADLLVADWADVRTVTDSHREERPALYYFSQRFRTRALGDFIAIQRRILEEAYGATFPVLVNFSDGAVYAGNFYAQGVDYFELLDSDGQNAIWGEDWANGSSSFQCAAYNIDLMRAAARDRGQTIGHYLIAHANRLPWDIKLKAAGEVARGVKIFKNFSYGVLWGSHEGGPAWRTTLWHAKPENWRANAEIVREIGGVEDLLVPAMPAPAQVAILYSSASDVWTLDRNNAFGFDRMHTWMALAHAQIPVDILAERQVEKGSLSGYRVCYLSGPNLTRAAAQKLGEWVDQGGVLVMTAGAASRDEFNRPLTVFNSRLPADRTDLSTGEAFLGAGSAIYKMRALDTVTVGTTTVDVLSVRQSLTPHPSVDVLGVFSNGAPALVRGKSGKGLIYYAGFLPALDYIRQAELKRQALSQLKLDLDLSKATPSEPDQKRLARLTRSRNPWEFPPATREMILEPVRAAKIEPPLTCSVPLVDAVVMEAGQGLVIPLANYTLESLSKINFTVRVKQPVARIESIYKGKLTFEQYAGRVTFSLPLDCTDYVSIRYAEAAAKQ